MSIISKIMSFFLAQQPSLWMRDIDGQMARIVGLSHLNVVQYTLDSQDEQYTCSYTEWASYPIWSDFPGKDRGKHEITAPAEDVTT